MYIQPNNNSVNMHGSNWNPNFWKRMKQKALDAFPEYTIKNGNTKVGSWESMNEKISRPLENRLIMGATALVTQPTIDYSNHKVDEETRAVSCIRTVAKIVAGTVVGCIVRGSCYKLVGAMTNVKGAEKWSKKLLPTKNLKELIDNETSLNNYRNALSTFLAIMAMSVTNFLLDAPLTVFLTNRLNEQRMEKIAKKKQKEAEGGITNAKSV